MSGERYGLLGKALRRMRMGRPSPQRRAPRQPDVEPRPVLRRLPSQRLPRRGATSRGSRCTAGPITALVPSRQRPEAQAPRAAAAAPAAQDARPPIGPARRRCGFPRPASAPTALREWRPWGLSETAASRRAGSRQRRFRDADDVAHADVGQVPALSHVRSAASFATRRSFSTGSLHHPFSPRSAEARGSV